MEGKIETITQADSSLEQQTTRTNASTMEKSFQLCPLCHSEVKLFFIDFNKKILICENVDCVYPFEDNLKFVKHDDKYGSDEELDNLVMQRNRPYSSSDATALSELEKYSAICGLEGEIIQRPLSRNCYDIKQDDSNSVTSNVKEVMLPQDKEKLLQNVEAIKKLCVELNTEERPPRKGPLIKNAKWLKNLMKLQAACKRPLLSSEEANLVICDKRVGLPEKIAIARPMSIAISTGGSAWLGTRIELKV